MSSQAKRLYTVLSGTPLKKLKPEEVGDLLSEIRIVVQGMIAREDYSSAEKLIDHLLYSWLCDTHSGYETHLELVTAFNKAIERRNLLRMTPQISAS